MIAFDKRRMCVLRVGAKDSLVVVEHPLDVFLGCEAKIPFLVSEEIASQMARDRTCAFQLEVVGLLEGLDDGSRILF